jgi:hypothetical protein
MAFGMDWLLYILSVHESGPVDIRENTNTPFFLSYFQEYDKFSPWHTQDSRMDKHDHRAGRGLQSKLYLLCKVKEQALDHIASGIDGLGTFHPYC